MRFIENSYQVEYSTSIKEWNKVYLFQQFFMHKNEERLNEIRYCLKANCNNDAIETVYLLNEKPDCIMYTPLELGVNEKEWNKIMQIPMGHRMNYSDVIHYVKWINLDGYIIIANADIFFDESLQVLKSIDLINKPTMFSQLRYEFDGNYNNIKIFGPRSDSQDAWIYHTTYNERLYKHLRAFKFQLGQAGCDNHIAYLFKMFGFNIINDPMLIHCLHYHKTQIREYTQDNSIKSPYMLINVNGSPPLKNHDVHFDDNKKLFDYISLKLKNKQSFIIPRIAGVENNVAHTKSLVRSDVMKNNAGIKLSNQKSVDNYSKMYLKAFSNCEIYCLWEKHGEVYKGISASQDFVEHQVCSINTQKCWAFALDIFHYIYSNAWTTALRGKRILIVSSFIDSIEKKIPIREHIYGVDLFPECTFLFIKPPQTQGNNKSDEWNIELANFYERLDELQGLYDIALVSAGGYGNIICNFIYEIHGASAIYVGGVLSLYFGVYGRRWLEERPSMLKAYINEHWSRPIESERPAGYLGVEKSCYW